jgi:excisionase family DNA binding protein
MKLNPQNKILLTHCEASELLGISENTLRKSITTLQIPYVFVGKHRMYCAESLRLWALNRAAESVAPLKMRRRA